MGVPLGETGKHFISGTAYSVGLKIATPAVSVRWHHIVISLSEVPASSFPVFS